MSSIGDGAFDMTSVLILNNVGEDKTMMLRHIVILFKSTRIGNMEFGDPLASVRVSTRQEFKIALRVANCNAGDMQKVSHIDEREDERRKWKVYHRNVRKY